MSWLLWGILLLLQNASFTWVSRARNSGSLGYHAVASVGSNGIWMLGQFIVIDKVVKALASGDAGLIAGTVAFYTLFTVIGSVGMHHILMTYVEKGKRAVGARSS